MPTPKEDFVAALKTMGVPFTDAPAKRSHLGRKVATVVTIKATQRPRAKVVGGFHSLAEFGFDAEGNHIRTYVGD